MEAPTIPLRQRFKNICFKRRIQCGTEFQARNFQGINSLLPHYPGFLHNDDSVRAEGDKL